MDFVTLHNFMITFYNAIVKNKIFRAKLYFEQGKPDVYKLYQQEKKMEFNRSELTSFSYIDALKNNDMVSEIKIILKDYFENEYAYHWNDNFILAKSICFCYKEYSNLFDYLFITLELMRKCKLLK